MTDSTMSDSRRLKIDELMKHMLPPGSGNESEYDIIKKSLAQFSEDQITKMLREAILKRIKESPKSNTKAISYPELFRTERIQYILTAEDDLRELDGLKSRSIKEQNHRKHELEALDRVGLNELYASTRVSISDAAIKKSDKKNAGKRHAAEFEDGKRGSSLSR